VSLSPRMAFRLIGSSEYVFSAGRSALFMYMPAVQCVGVLPLETSGGRES
jgi:hypothetical protein